MKNTTNYNLNKPDQTDFYDIDDLNDNADILDSVIKGIDDKVVVATTSKAGLIKPDGTTLTIDTDGTAHAKQTTIDNTMSSSSANPVQNKVVKKYVDDGLVLKADTATVSQLSNPTLLLNGDFRINQRGQSEYGSTYTNLYTVDRWKIIVSGIVVNTTENGIKITNVSDTHTATHWIRQTIENLIMDSSHYTVSAKVRKSRADLQVRCGYADVSNTTDWQIISGVAVHDTWSETERASITFTTDRGLQSGDWIEIAWVKLEQGSIATPFVPRLYGEELALCQRYYQVFKGNGYVSLGYGFISSADNIPYLTIPHTVEMRDTNSASIVVNGTFWSDTLGENIASSRISMASNGCNTTSTMIKLDSAEGTSGDLFTLATTPNTNTYIAIDKEL